MDTTTPDYELLAKKFKSSVLAYGFRQVFVIFITFAYNILLTRYLSPSEFGVVAVVTIVVNISMLLSDGGLGVYLVQRHADVTPRDLNRIFTFQLFAAAAIMLFCFLAAGLATALGADGGLFWMIAAASLSLPLFIVRGVSIISLDRTIQINRVVWVEVSEEVAFALTAVCLAFYGYGAWSVVAAQLCKGLVGAFMASRVSGTRLALAKVGMDDELRKGIRFGFHYQAANLITMARVSVIPLFIVPYFGFQAGGFVDRSWYFAAAPLSIILAVQKRVMFPFISRIQRDVNKVREILEDSIYLSAVLDKLMFLPLILFAPEIIGRVLGPQWLPMMPLLYWLLAGNVIFGALSGSIYPVANALGRSDLVSLFNIVGFAASWLLIVPLSLAMGIVGVGVAGFVMWLGLHWMKFKLTGIIGDFKYYGQCFKPLLASLAVIAPAWYFLPLISCGERSIWAIACLSLAALVMYLLVLAVFDRVRLNKIYLKLRHT